MEGVALSRGSIHHAWITLDGTHAVDVTWREPSSAYFGIAFPTTADLARALDAREGCFGLLDPIDDQFLKLMTGPA